MFTKVSAVKAELLNVTVPVVFVVNFAFFNENLISCKGDSFCPPTFCDLNKEPTAGCSETRLEPPITVCPNSETYKIYFVLFDVIPIA